MSRERVFRVSMINSRLNFRMFLDIEACSMSEAGAKARGIIGPSGYDIIESCTCIR